LVIDEASMMGDTKLRKLDKQLRKCYTSNKVFGGKQLVLVGDPFQLPPVLDSIIFYSPYYFSYNLKMVRLLKVIRQKDELFSSALNLIRIGSVGEKVRELISDLSKNVVDDPAIVVATNSEADEINSSRLDNLPGEVVEYVRTTVVEGLDVSTEMGTRLVENLRLKVGCKVMLIKNIDVRAGLTNGTRGEVVGFEMGIGPIVRFFLPEKRETVVMVSEYTEKTVFKNGIQIPEESIDYRLTVATVDVLRGYSLTIVSNTQIPLNLCWATTVHKMQGCTLDGILIDCKNIKFEGQFYTALSRVTKKEGITIRNFNDKCIKANYTLIKQLTSIKNGKLLVKHSRDHDYEGFLSAQENIEFDWF
jgi:ATP-dependent DNA helicase PIF1